MSVIGHVAVKGNFNKASNFPSQYFLEWLFTLSPSQPRMFCDTSHSPIQTEAGHLHRRLHLEYRVSALEHHITPLPHASRRLTLVQPQISRCPASAHAQSLGSPPPACYLPQSSLLVCPLTLPSRLKSTLLLGSHS